METVTFYIKSSDNYLFGFNHSNYVVKTEFLKKSSRTLILAICYSNIQSYFKIDLILTMIFNVYFLYRKSWIFWATYKKSPTAWPIICRVAVYWLPDNMALKIVISTGNFRIRWNVLSLSFSERESGKMVSWLSDFYHNYFISNDCIQHSGKISICNT